MPGSHSLAAELHVSGLPAHTGSLSRDEHGGLILQNLRPLLHEDAADLSPFPVDVEGELVFRELLDESGNLVVATVYITSKEDSGLLLNLASTSSRQALQEALGIIPAEGGQADNKVQTSDSLTTQDRSQKNSPAPVSTSAVAELGKRAQNQLHKDLTEFLLALGDHLLDLSSGHQQLLETRELFYESMNIVKKNQEQLRSRTLEIIDANLHKPLPVGGGGGNSMQGVDELDLVTVEDFEDKLNMRRLVQSGQQEFQHPLECLTIRYAELHELDPHKTHFPLDVDNICQSFRRALQEVEVPLAALPEIYTLFGERVLPQLGFLYNNLNSYLGEQGIAPELEEKLLKYGSILHKPGRSTTPPARENKPDSGGESLEEAAPGPGVAEYTRSGSSDLAAGDDEGADSLYQSVISALNFQRASRPGASRPGASGSGPKDRPADSEAITRALAAMQQDAGIRSALQDASSLRQYLADKQPELTQLSGTEGFSHDSLNQLDLIDTMFDSLRQDVDVSSEMIPAMGDLQIPLAKLALLEPRFFLDKQHPARGVIDRLTQLSASGNYPNKALEHRLTDIVNNIVEHFEDSSEVFTEVLEDLDSLRLQQEKAQARNIARVVETQEGQQRLRQAQRATDSLIRSRIRPPLAPRVLVELMDAGWRDLLILAHLREGTDSKQWKSYVKSLDTLSLWLIQHQSGNLSDQLKVERALEAEPFVDLLRQQISSTLVTNVEHEGVLTELLDILAGREELELVAIENTGKELEKASTHKGRIETLPRLRRWLTRVEALNVGTWLSFRDDKGKKRRMQLVWINEAGNRLIFVNERGQKIADLSHIALARQLSHGAKPSATEDQLSVVDQGMYNTLEQVQKSLSFSFNHDSLTGLVNRKTFIRQLQDAFRNAQAKDTEHTVLYIDIDQFNLVNEVFDELVGNEVLAEFGALLAHRITPGISVARLEGDCFAALLLNQSGENARLQAESICSEVENHNFEVEQETVSFTVSMGLVVLDNASSSAEDSLRNAGVAAEKAKRNGRNQVSVYEAHQASTREHLAEEAEARRTLERTLDSKQFELRAQPIVRSGQAAAGESFQHYEILLAVRNSEGNLVSPQKFINAAERFGHMVTVDRWVVQAVFSWINEAVDAQKKVPYLSINLSGHSISDDAFMEFLLEQISEYGVGTDRICFEVTETGAISNLVKAADFVREFRNIGCHFAIDDFGTGIASHTYLRELPVDYVKIDGSFVSRIHNSANDYAMVKSINELAHFLGRETIAEFVENEEIIHKLQEIGVDHLQGWGVGRPAPLSSLLAKLDSVET